MPPIRLFFSLAIVLLLYSCDNSHFTFEIDPRNGDTINITNERGRQGRWVINTDCANDLPKLPKDTLVLPQSLDIKKNQGYILVSNPGVLTTGNYVDNQKQGSWISYGEDGSITRIEEYKNDVMISK